MLANLYPKDAGRVIESLRGTPPKSSFFSWMVLAICTVSSGYAFGQTSLEVGPSLPQATPGQPAETKPAETKAAAEDSKKNQGDLKATKAAPDKPDTEKWNVKLGGHVQMDYVLWANAPDSIPNTQNYFNFRRLRLVADGTGYDVCDFRLQMTLEPEPFGDLVPDLNLTPQVKDAYFSMNEIPYLGRMRLGNFFVPFSLEQVTNDTNNIFLERSIPTQTVFAADREVGVAFYNCSQDERLTWTTGCFFDSMSEGFKKRLDDNQGYRVSGRLTWLPYDNDQPKARRLVHTGLGILFTDDNDDRVRIRTRPQVSEGPRLIDTGLVKADTYTTGNVESAIVLGRFAVQSEAFVSTLQMLTGESPLLSGAYVHTSWFVTGESRNFDRFGQHGAQFGRNAPFQNFRFKRGEFRPGALELKARWSYLDMNQLNAGQYNDLTVGFNWYWSDRTRWMFDWIHPITSQETLYGQTASDLLGMRFDFNW